MAVKWLLLLFKRLVTGVTNMQCSVTGLCAINHVV